MTDGINRGWPEILGSIAEGGVPQVIAGPAGKAISRLIGGAADIPAAYFESLSQSIRDKKTSRSKISEAVATAAALRAAKDLDILDATIAQALPKLVRQQENTNAVGMETMLLLGEEPSQQKEDGPSEDWMNIFEGLAEKASSDEVRKTLARILAGEIRQPGAFSFRALYIMSIMDQKLAADMTTAKSWLFNSSYVPINGPIRVGDKYSLLLGLVSSGIFQHGHAKYWDTDGVNALLQSCGNGDYWISIKTAKAMSFSLKVFDLTDAGSEIMDVISADPDFVVIKEICEGISNEDIVECKVVKSI